MGAHCTAGRASMWSRFIFVQYILEGVQVYNIYAALPRVRILSFPAFFCFRSLFL
jgi:hypothetical protein